MAAAVVGLMLAGCSSEASPNAGPSSTGSISPTSSTSASPVQSFESSRHGYRLDVPTGWDVSEYEGTWSRLAQFSPGAEVPGEDVVAPPGLSSFLVSNSMEIPSGMTASEWRGAFDARVAAGATEDCPQTAGATDIVGGEPASLVEQPCEDSIIIGRSLTHGGRGYYFTIRFPADDEAARATLEGVVRSIRFTGD